MIWLRGLLRYVLGVLSRIAGLGFLKVICAVVSAIILAHMVATFPGRTLLQLGIELSAVLVLAAVATGAVSVVLSRAQNACEQRSPEEEDLAEIAPSEPPEPARKETAHRGRPPSLQEEPADEPVPPWAAAVLGPLRTWFGRRLLIVARMAWRLLAIAALVGLVWAGAEHGRSYYTLVKIEILRLQARIEMGDIAKALAGDIQSGEVATDPATLPEWLKDNVSKKGRSFSGLDPFGQPYILENAPNGCTLRSAGPDGTYGTPDDLEQSLVTGNNPPH